MPPGKRAFSSDPALTMTETNDQIKTSDIPGGIGQGLDPTVVQVAAAIEDHLLDALGQGTFGHQLTHGLGGIAGAAGLEAGAEVLVEGGSRTDGALGGVVDDVDVDVVVGAEHRQPGPVGGASEGAAQTAMALLGLLFAR